MKNTRNLKKPVSAEAIASIAERGEDVSRFFTGLPLNAEPHAEGTEQREITSWKELRGAARDLNIDWGDYKKKERELEDRREKQRSTK